MLIFRILQRASHFPLKSVSPVLRHVCVSLPSKASAGTEIKPQRRRAVKAICHINSKYDARKGHKTPSTHNFLCGIPPSHRRDVCTVASQHETGILRLVALTTRGLSPPCGVHEMPHGETAIHIPYNPANQYQMSVSGFHATCVFRRLRAGTCALYCDGKDLIGPYPTPHLGRNISRRIQPYSIAWSYSFSVLRAEVV